jgi:excisionase family DNA binding protein
MRNLNLDETLTIEEVAQILRVHEQTVRNLIRQRKLKAFRVGTQLRVKRSELERYIEQAQE